MGAAAVVRRAGLLRPVGGCWTARARAWGGHGGPGVVGYSTTPSAPARRRLLVASALGVRESLPAQSLREEAVAAVEVDEDADGSAEILQSRPDAAPDAKTVRVKFVLEKQCAFGQQFLVVGDDPALGLWNPAKAAALDWSDGHVWTVKMDLPANKSIEFKFLLRDVSGRVRWQPGANRTLRTTETQNTLIVHEAWDHVKKQRVSEEEEELSVAAAKDIALFSDHHLSGSTGAMLAEDELITDLESINSAVVDAPSPHGETEAVNEENQPQFILENDQKILNELHGIAPQNAYLSDEDNAKLNEDDDATMLQVANSLTTNIFENDLAWARKSLQQLFRFLGFQIGTTRTWN